MRSCLLATYASPSTWSAEWSGSALPFDPPVPSTPTPSSTPYMDCNRMRWRLAPPHVRSAPPSATGALSTNSARSWVADQLEMICVVFSSHLPMSWLNSLEESRSPQRSSLGRPDSVPLCPAQCCMGHASLYDAARNPRARKHRVCGHGGLRVRVHPRPPRWSVGEPLWLQLR